MVLATEITQEKNLEKNLALTRTLNSSKKEGAWI